MIEQPPTMQSPEAASPNSGGWRTLTGSAALLRPASAVGSPTRATRATVHPGNGPAGGHAGSRGGNRNPRPLGQSGRVRLNPEENGGQASELQRQLSAMIAGQDEAIKEIVNIYQMHLAGLNAPQRPIGTLLFLGPTGTGKTRIVEALAEALVGTPRAVVKVGSPPGYLGHRETHPLLSQENLNQYWTDRTKVSFVLFDEIEKASDALWNLLLGILDKATLTLGDNRRVDFSDAMIFLTSNLGAKEMSSIVSPTLGFGAVSGEAAAMDPDTVASRIRKAALEAARRKFPPEFINRLDKMIVFHPLRDNHLRRIVEIELGRLQDRILTCSAAGGFVLRVTERAKKWLLAEGVDSRYGARYLCRTIEKNIVQPLSRLVASGQISMGDLVEIEDGPGERLSFNLVGQDLSTQEMSEVAGPWVQPWLQLAAALGDNPGPKTAPVV
jgi:ATP-dependent Clp protease ATP-binding subunit ClpA